MGVLEGPGISNNGLVLFLDKYNNSLSSKLLIWFTLFLFLGTT